MIWVFTHRAAGSGDCTSSQLVAHKKLSSATETCTTAGAGSAPNSYRVWMSVNSSPACVTAFPLARRPPTRPRELASSSAPE